MDMFLFCSIFLINHLFLTYLNRRCIPFCHLNPFFPYSVTTQRYQIKNTVPVRATTLDKDIKLK